MDQGLSGGFTEPSYDAARAFRACLQAMARPGSVQPMSAPTPPAPLSPAAAAVLLTLCDSATPLYLAPSHDSAEARAWIAFHCAAPLVSASEAAFALGDWAALKGQPFAIGSADYPDRSATLIVEVETRAPNARLAGAGIKESAAAYLPDIAALRANAALYPLGFDCYFCAQDRLYALPRSTYLEAL